MNVNDEYFIYIFLKQNLCYVIYINSIPIRFDSFYVHVYTFNFVNEHLDVVIGGVI